MMANASAAAFNRLEDARGRKMFRPQKEKHETSQSWSQSLNHLSHGVPRQKRKSLLNSEHVLGVVLMMPVQARFIATLQKQ